VGVLVTLHAKPVQIFEHLTPDYQATTAKLRSYIKISFKVI